MSIDSRLNRIENHLSADRGRCVCPHGGLHIWWGSYDGRAGGGGSPAELPDCDNCGGTQILLMVVYSSDWNDQSLATK